MHCTKNQSPCVRNGMYAVTSADKSKVVFFPGTELLSLRHLSLTRFSTHAGKICNSGATEHGDLLFIHSCQSDRSNGVYTFLMSRSRAALTLYTDCRKASHHGSYKIEIEFWMCFFYTNIFTYKDKSIVWSSSFFFSPSCIPRPFWLSW